jgi:hypothetical protein
VEYHVSFEKLPLSSTSANLTNPDADGGMWGATAGQLAEESGWRISCNCSHCDVEYHVSFEKLPLSSTSANLTNPDADGGMWGATEGQLAEE